MFKKKKIQTQERGASEALEVFVACYC